MSNVLSEIHTACEVLGKWSATMSELQAAETIEAFSLSNFTNELGTELRIRLGRLQAIIGLDGASGFSSIISDLTEAYQCVIEINKPLVDVGKLTPELINNLDGLLLPHLRVNARLEQVQIWNIARQGEIRLEMENVAADINHTTRRFRLTSQFIAVVLVIACLRFGGLAFTYLQIKVRVQLMLFAALALLLGYAAFRCVAYYANSANKQSDVSLLLKLDDEL